MVSISVRWHWYRLKTIHRIVRLFGKDLSKNCLKLFLKTIRAK